MTLTNSQKKTIFNSKKSKVILFNTSRKYDFPPEVGLEYVTHKKLFGVMVNSDLRWAKNTEYICKKVMQRMWVLQRINRFKLDTEHLFDIRSLLELAVPV